MRFAAVVFWLLGISLFACDPSFESCAKKVLEVAEVTNTRIDLPLEGSKVLVYSTTELRGASQSDPFLHLYLFDSKHPPKYPFKLNKNLPAKELASINEKIVCGKIVQKQRTLEHLGKFSSPITAPSVILNGCCFVVAIGTPKGVITRRFLRHFMREGGVYGDLGVRIKRCENRLVVEYRNPFVRTPLEVGDRILSIDGKKVSDKASFEEAVLFAKPGKKLDLRVERCGKRLELHPLVYKRAGGGYLSDSFFETLGVFLDEKLRVVRSSYPQIKKGDSIVALNSITVKTIDDVKYALSKVTTKKFLVALNRDGLVFFIKMKSKI